MAEIGKRQSFKDRDDWRAWLTANCDTATELWLILYKKHTSKPTVSYNEAVEEALCLGWIDGIIKGIDEEKYAIRFSPRRRGSIWSESVLVNQILNTVDCQSSPIRRANSLGDNPGSANP